MSWPMFWSVLGVVVGTLVLMSPLLYVSMRREVRRTLREVPSVPLPLEPLARLEATTLGRIGSIRSDLAEIRTALGKLDRIHGHIEQAGLCVGHEDAPEGGRSGAGS